MNLKTLMIGYNVTHQNPSCREWIAADLQNVSKMRNGREFSNELTVQYREDYYDIHA